MKSIGKRLTIASIVTAATLIGFATASGAEQRIVPKTSPNAVKSGVKEWHLNPSRLSENGLTVTSLEGLSRCTRAEVRRLYLRGAGEPPVGALSGLPNLAELDVSENGLREVPVTVLSITTLRRLWLAGNPIEGLPSGIAGLKSLTYLNLDRTGLLQLPDELGELAELRFLRLNDTPIASIPDSLSGLPNMRRLYARNTKLREVPRALASWRSLEDVALDGTDIAAVPDWLVDLPKLKRVSFAGCKRLASLPADIDGWRRLQVLDLSGTPLAENAQERRRVRSALGDEVVIFF